MALGSLRPAVVARCDAEGCSGVGGVGLDGTGTAGRATTRGQPADEIQVRQLFSGSPEAPSALFA